jgi:hypothetical protein
MYENEFMNPSERLTAFLDGELTQEEAGTLFYELAQNSELQDEMRQLVTIRNTFRNSMLVPPDILKSKIFKRAGFADNAMSGLSKTAAVLAGLFYSRSAVTAVAVVTLGILSYIMISTNLGINEPEKGITMKTASLKIPVSSSTEKTDAVYNNHSKTVSENGIEKAVIVSKNKFTVNRNDKTGRFFKTENEKTNNNSDLVLASKDKDNTKDTQNQINDITNSMMVNNDGLFVNLSKFNNKLFNSNPFDLHRLLERVNFELRTFYGNSTPNFNLSKDNVSLLNNFSLGVTYTLNDHNTIGVAFGFENFLMSFDKYDGDILYTYRQSYNSEWLAATYQYSWDEIESTNIRPQINVLVGGTKVGPVLKIGTGVSWYLTDNFALMLGFESGWLIYPNKSDWIQGEWFSTNKKGVLVGLKVGF